MICSLSPVESKGQSMLVLVVTDLTEQKRSEEILAAERIGTLVEYNQNSLIWSEICP
jgi:hypothetical protein